jgi:hypothetical protein
VSTIADGVFFHAFSLPFSDGTTNNLHEYIAMSVDDVADLESMVNDVYSNNHGVVLNETILPRFFSRLPHP